MGNGNVTPIKKEKLPESIELTNVERLELENYNLREKIISIRIESLKQEGGDLISKQKELAEKTSKRLGVDLKRYRVDLKTGKGTLIKEEQKK